MDGAHQVNTYDPSKPITFGNWPAGLRLPPLRRALEAAPKKPTKAPNLKPAPEAEEAAPWWSTDV